jgi:cytochrome oxidase assembly protein ShyY1
MMSRLLAIVAMALVTALTASLGQWQMRRADEKRAQQSIVERAAKAGPYVLDGKLLGSGPITGRLVQVQGRFIPTTPSSSTTVLIRGWRAFTCSPRLKSGTHRFMYWCCAAGLRAMFRTGTAFRW